jgi:hypothetical protein
MDEADFFAHGLDRGLTHANVQNQVGDVLSEGAARRRTLPYASQAIADEARQEQELAATRYLLPAQMKMQGDIAAAATTAQGRVQAAQVPGQNLSTRALYDVINALTEKTGKVPDPETIETLKRIYSQGQ